MNYFYSKGPKFSGCTVKMYETYDENIFNYVGAQLMTYFLNEIEFYIYPEQTDFKFEIIKNGETLKVFTDASKDFFFSSLRDYIQSIL